MNQQKSKIWITIIAVTVSSLFKGCYRELIIGETEPTVAYDGVVAFDQIHAFTDLEDHMLLYTLPADTIISFSPFVTFGDYHSVSINGIELINGTINELGEVMVNHPYTVVAQNSSGKENFQLYFTNLPLIHVYTDKIIIDDPKVLSWTEIQQTDGSGPNGKTQLFSSYAGIEIRGRTSAQLDKKSYGLELWENRLGKDRTASLLGMRNGEDWILDAMYIDPLRMRNKLSFELWEKMWRQNNESPWLTSIPGIQCEFIELFINHRYMGLYCLSEKLDEKLINLAEGQLGAEGVMYKAIDWTGGSTAFTTYNSDPRDSMIWEGWEQTCPDGHYCWNPLSALRKTVVMGDDHDFAEIIDTLINMECAADYYLFTNLILAHDNIIKNFFLARYPSESRFLMIPWDLEGSWGIMWHGGESSTHGMLENNLFNRLMDLEAEEFDDMLESRWSLYRESIFKLDSLIAPAQQYTDLLKRSGAIERENRRWEGADTHMDAALQYLTHWSRLRIEYLDEVFD